MAARGRQKGGMTMGEYVDKPPFISPDEPWGPCDWLDSCWAPASDWRRDPQVDHFVPVCPEHSQAARIATLEEEVERLRGENDTLHKALNQRGHVAEFREDGFSLEHPIECRKAGLIICPVNVACAAEQSPPAIGRFTVTLDEAGYLVLGEKHD